MKEQKKLYDKAKRTQLPEDWNNYQMMRNTVNVLLDTAHKDYYASLFKQFYAYIKRLQKDHSGVSPLTVNGKTSSTAKDKAKILNNQFQSVFTKENLLNIPKLPLTVFPQMSNISFSAHGIQLLLENLVPGKAPGPGGLPTYAFKINTVPLKLLPFSRYHIHNLLALVPFLRIG